jgi:hypothetical protein
MSSKLYDKLIIETEDGFKAFEKKHQEKAIERIENVFCPICKKRIVRVVSSRDCLVITKKVGHRKYKKIRCSNFKKDMELWERRKDLISLSI